MYSTLISVAELAEQLERPDWRIFDCRFDLAKPEAGRIWFNESHIPGAQFADLDRDLAVPKTAITGRHPLPASADFQHKLAAWGVTPQTQVVVYDQLGGSLAARLWWMLRYWLGHAAVAVLDGGFPAWQAAGRPLSQTQRQASPSVYSAAPDETQWRSSAAVAELVRGGAGGRLLDARTAARFAGREEPIDPIAGHIPGSRNWPLQNNLAANGCFLPAKRLREQFLGVLGDTAPEQVVHLCGSGVTACHNLLAMDSAGLSGSKLYVGSWSEWIALHPDWIAVDSPLSP